MSSLLSRLVNTFLGKQDATIDVTNDEDVVLTSTPPTAPNTTVRMSVASDVDSKRWFSGQPPMARDSVDSSPDTARWFKKPKFVAPGETLHHPSAVDAGRSSQA